MLQIEPFCLIHSDYYCNIKFIISGHCTLGGQYEEIRGGIVGKRKDILEVEFQ